jgi:spore germination protein YaaH
MFRMTVQHRARKKSSFLLLPVLCAVCLFFFASFLYLQRPQQDNGPNAGSVTSQAPPWVSYGFFVSWDPRSLIELKDYGYIDKLDVLIPDWYSAGDNFLPVVHRKKEVDQLAKQHHVQVMPLVNNERNGKWDGDWLHSLLISQDKRSNFIRALLTDVKNNGYSGINIDFEAVKPDDKDLLTQFMKELSVAFHQQGLQVTQDVPVDDGQAFDYVELAKLADRLILMLYDEHDESASPGSVASLHWLETRLQQLPIPKEKRVIGLGNYGYDWVVGSDRPARTLTFDEIMSIAARTDGKVNWDSNSQTPYLKYNDGENDHIVWFLDGPAFYDQLKVASLDGAKEVALWRIGSEDLSIWEVIGKTGRLENVERMQTFRRDLPVWNSNGERLPASHPGPGERELQLDANGWIKSEVYKKY